MKTASERRAGAAVPLFSLRGKHDVGIGEYLDLLPFVDWAADAGMSIVALLPLGELAPGEYSPYSALSSFALDPIHISPSEVPELSGVSMRFPASAPSKVDREAARAFKTPLLTEAFQRFQALREGDARRARFVDFQRRNRSWLGEYAVFAALSEEHGFQTWLSWPEDLKNHKPAALRRARESLASRIALLEYLQFIADEQWQAVRTHARSRGVWFLGDLAFSPSENSADVWNHPEAFDVSRSVGAPPDDFSATGQRWGLPMPRWEGQRKSDWRWLRARSRRLGDLYDLVRIDHVVGLFRTFFFVGEKQGGFEPAKEPAQKRQGEEVLRLMQSAGAPTRIVAEDLGLIPPFVPKVLAALDIPGYRVLRWERTKDGFTDPARYPECSIATTGTHDTDTLFEWWQTLSAEDRKSIAALCDGRIEVKSPELSASGRHALLERLFASPSRYAVLPLQDLFGWRDRINVPGVSGGGNWTWRLPAPMAELERDEALRAETQFVLKMIETTGRKWRPAGPEDPKSPKKPR